ncbi:MAG: T9SS type A sorting domain-containing protein, partial [candidate division KSB1 bacterium]|nr:T9SS type A sorting domain-containing protein [candidate division KSB1 bacterium]
TDPRRLVFKSLFIVYSQYLTPNEGLKILSSREQQEILQAINNFQQYIWNSTYALQIKSDTLWMARPLTIHDFTKKDDAWGYYLSPRPVQTDLSNRSIRQQDYDILVVIYCWWNSQSTWSGYSGYIFRDTRSLKQKPAIIAQPIVPGHPLDETILIHEFLHYLDNRYEALGEPRFYSPHHRILYTTFDRDEDYYRWILETWPTEWWFKLDVGQIVASSNQATMASKIQSQIDPNIPMFLQNYPNPFHQTTTISFSVPANDSSDGPMKVRLVVYDRLGKLATILLDQMLAPGNYDVTWDGRDLHGTLLASGIYFYQLILPTQRQAKKMLLLR